MMTAARSRHTVRSIVLGLATSVIFACDSANEPSGLGVPSRPSMAKAASGVTVAAANPAFGDQGQVNESVTITGSGFAPGAQASWLRNGAVDTTITVTSTRYVSSTTLVATINISPKSPVDFRDIMVANAAGGRTQGIGSLLFEVTQAVPVPGTSWIRSINDNGEATGSINGTSGGVFYYNAPTRRLDTLSTNGTGYDISSAGTVIVGSGGGGGGFPYLYTRSSPGAAWQTTALPVDPTTTSGVARSMVTDASGLPTQIGGVEYYPAARNQTAIRAVAWIWQPGTLSWLRVLLPGDGTEVRHRAISNNGLLGGTARNGRTQSGAVWTPNGSGGYTLTFLPGGSSVNTVDAVNAVRADGGLVGGFINGITSVYWLAQAGGTWSAPITVAGGCNAVKDIADSGRFILNACPISGGGGQSTAVYTDPPYATLIRLGGLGPKGTVGFAAGISHGGHYAGGYANLNNQMVGIYWNLP